MPETAEKIRKLYHQGYGCSQILLLLGLEAQGVSNPGLVRAMAGLAGGVGSSGRLCGALTGGACLIALYAGRGAAGEAEHDRFYLMMDQLIEWFEGVYGRKCGGMDCEQVADCEPFLDGSLPPCCGLVLATWEKVVEILRRNRIAVAAG